jgi:protease PrsW
MAARARRSDRRIILILAIAATVVAALGSLLFLRELLGFDTGRVLAAVVLATLPAPLYVALGLRIDRYEPEPTKLLAFAFLWGAIGACGIALLVNSLGREIVSAGFGAKAGAIYGPRISAPIVEEGAKALALFAVYRWRRSEFNGVLDGIVYALMVGLGFAMVENILYYARGPDSFFGRGVLSPYAHPLFTAFTGIGFGIAATSVDRTKKVRAVVLGLAGAIIAHGIWNGVFSASGEFVLWYVFAAVPAFIALLIVIWLLNRAERRTITKYLRPDVESGLLSEEELRRLASLRERRNARRAAKRRGKGALAAEKAFQRTATDLAFQRRDDERRGLSDTAEEQEQQRAFAAALRALRDAARDATPVEPAKQAKETGPPPGWYADPWQRGRLRFWDGRAYTWHTAAARAAVKYGP